MPGLCFNAYASPESSPTETVVLENSTADLAKGGGFNFNVLNSATDQGNIVFNSDFMYKIYRRRYLSNNQAPPVMLSWIGCEMGSLSLESLMTTGQVMRVYKESKAQTIKVGSISKVNKNLPDYLCLDRYPSM